MLNPLSIAKALLHQTKSYFPTCKDEPFTDDENDVARQLFDILKLSLDGQTDFEEDVHLALLDESPVEDDEESDENLDEYRQTSSQDWQSQEISIGNGISEQFELEYMERVIKCYETKGWKSVLCDFKRVKHRNYIARFKNYIEQTGTKKEKLIKLNTSVKDRFIEALGSRNIVHDYDIQRWGLEFSKQIELLDFKASDKWLYSFKKNNRIVSRKINKFVTKVTIENIDEIRQSAQKFVQNMKERFQEFSSHLILNSDQSGFQYLLQSKRMHAIKGEKIVTALSKSVNKQTHSYTIQPIVTLSGHLLGPLFICLQEKDGTFGPNVKKEVDALLIKCKNVTVTCSRSGKLQKGHVKYWSETVLYPSVNGSCLLLLDSWNGQQDEELFKSTNGKVCERVLIPKNTTSMIQPLDVYGFRQWKNLARKITSRIILDQLDIDISLRANIITMQSLIYNQLSARIFKEMWLYSWYKSGYLNDRPERFINVNEACFRHSALVCEITDCESSNFIQCSHCRLHLCFNHFFLEYHFHSDDDMSQNL